MIVADDVLKLRKARGWSQADLAAQLRVQQPTIARIEGGQPISGPLSLLLEQLIAALPEAAE